MPLFEFRCSSCEHLEETLQKFTDPPPAECPSCGKAGTMAKEVSLTSFQLKGGGWYKDLYSSTPKDGGKESTASKDTKSSGGGSGSSGSSGSGSSGSGSGGSGSGGSSSSGSGSSGGSSGSSSGGSSGSSGGGSTGSKTAAA